VGLKSIRFLELHVYFSGQEVALGVKDPSSKVKIQIDIEAIAKKIISERGSSAKGPDLPYYTNGTLDEKTGWVAAAIPDRSKLLGHKEEGEIGKSVENVAIGVYRRGKGWNIEAHRLDHQSSNDEKSLNKYGEEARFVHRLGTSMLGVLHDVMRQRMHRFSAFPNEISVRYWDDAVEVHRSRQRRESGGEAGRQRHQSANTQILPPSSQRLLPPWNRNHGVQGATLALDLRKSTFCMDQANSAEEFSQWLQLLVQILTKVTHLHGGVFDKFTGDGCLVHFLEEEQHVLYNKNAVAAAVECAFDMHEAVSFLLERLRKILRFDSALLGAGIGIDFGESHWSLDQQNNPVVVGKAVVGACRLCGSSAGVTSLTNVAYHQLSPFAKQGFENTTVALKDFPPDMEVRAWIKRAYPQDLSRTQKIQTLCHEVKTRGYGGF
jgi:class 3 adenylate cyclase